MRLPLSKVYRAFAELDSFSDEECVRFVVRVRAHRRGLLLWPLLAGGASMLLWIVVVMPAALFCLRAFARAGRTLQVASPDTAMMSVGALLVAGTLLVLVGGLTLRDRLLIRAIRGRVDLAACPRCGHSLLGLPLLPGGGRESVRCPECGSAVLLDEIGVNHADLIPREGGELATASPRPAGRS